MYRKAPVARTRRSNNTFRPLLAVAVTSLLFVSLTGSNSPHSASETSSSTSQADAPTPTPASPGDMVISQIYGSGGTAGATYRNSYVEIFNRRPYPVVTNRYAIALGLGAGPVDRSFARSSLQGIVVEPGQYLLIKMGSGGTDGANLPEPDLNAETQPPFPSSFFAASGKIALTGEGGDTSVFADCPLAARGLLDFVGFGSTNCFMGSGPAAGLTPTTAALRRNSGCTDTSDNANDFAVGVPNPRNSSSPFAPCSGQVVATPTPTPTPNPPPTLLTISGRTLTEAGAGIRSQVVTLTHDDGVVQTATTSSFGIFTFEGLQAGRTYIVSVRSKRYRFAPQVIALTSNVANMTMTALE